MKLLTIVVSAAAACLLNTAALVDAHGWLVQPVSRETTARGDENGSIGCPSDSPGQTTSFRPGQVINVRYHRNNHIGGFIRWAIAPRGQDNKATFDKNVFYYTCRESGATCVPAGQNTVYAGDNGAPANSIMCGDTIKLPSHLPAGDYVLQWTWMSAGSSYGNIAWANEQYRSCADIRFKTAGTGTKPSCPTFVGGDRVSRLQGRGNKQCFYFQSNDLVTSVFKGDNSNYQQYYKYGVPAEVERCGGGAAPAPAPAPAPTPAPAPAPASAPASTPAPAPAPAPAPYPNEDGNGTVRPPTVKKGVYEYCTTNSECGNGCCSDQLSDDYEKKCTPRVCARLAQGKKDQWQFCTVSSECANGCCSNRLSDDGRMKCTPGGEC